MAKKRKFRLEKRVKKTRVEVPRAKITVIGIGGGGSSIVAEIAPKIKKADFIVANTDRQALGVIARGASPHTSRGVGASKCFQFGQELTGGLGTGMNPHLGELAAYQEKEKIKEILEKTDLCILVACLGGGTGSGATPVFAEISQKLSLLSLGIFTLPFQFEGEKRAEIAKTSLEKLKANLNALAIIPNEKVFQIIDKQTPLQTAFSTINGILKEALAGLIETIYRPSLINIDFADLKMILEGKGRLAYLNSAEAGGQERAGEACRKVLRSPLQVYDIEGAERILFNITGSRGLKMTEVEQISGEISNFSKKAKVIFGISQSPSLNEKIKITLLAIGCGRPPHLRVGSGGRPAKTKRKTGSSQPPPIEKEIPVKSATSALPEPKPKEKAKPKQKERPKPKPKAKPKEVIEVKEVKEQKEERIKRNGLQIKKAAEEAEREILKKEEVWDAPAFLRRK